MRPSAYYNEIDAAAAAVLRRMVADGVVAPGDVDTRSIKDVTPDDLRGYTQCHFFAGGGFWSVSARLAGWPDDAPLWTGSCPCQPFSAAGKGGGTDDPRHLWPDFHRLIRACRPAVVMGEQVAGALGYGWFDGVRSDLARESYAARAVDFPACSVDAPHQRNRLYWIAVAGADELDGRAGAGRQDGPEAGYTHVANGGAVVNATSVGRRERRAEPILLGGRTATAIADASGVTLGDAQRQRLEGQPWHGDIGWRSESGRSTTAADVSRTASHVGNRDGHRCRGARVSDVCTRQNIPVSAGADGRGARRAEGRNGTYWSDAIWIECHDGKARRAQPGIRFLVDGLPGRVDLWRVGGNAIVPSAAAEVIAAFIDCYGLPLHSMQEAA